MIDHIHGTICQKDIYHAVIECGGIGYFCHISLKTSASIGSIGSEDTLYTRMIVREDEISLYGFSDVSERSCFDQLISVSGVGPKAALAILSDFSSEQFALAVAGGDYKLLTKTKGIGAKTAQRIVLELKDKISKSVDSTEVSAVSVTTVGNGNAEEAIAALQVLGYSQGEVSSVLCKLDVSLPSSELIRLALIQLGKIML